MNFVLAEAKEVLRRTPAAVRALLSGLPESWTQAREGAESWTPYDVVGHFIHGERTDWIPRARIILEQRVDRTFEPFDRFAQFRDSEGKSLEELLAAFDELRAANLATLDGWSLNEEQLELRGVHPAFGEVTLRQLLATWVAHDLNHLVQIARTMARQYEGEVGPWREYLGVLKR